MVDGVECLLRILSSSACLIAALRSQTCKVLLEMGGILPSAVVVISFLECFEQVVVCNVKLGRDQTGGKVQDQCYRLCMVW